jgi:hypothetical protein
MLSILNFPTLAIPPLPPSHKKTLTPVAGLPVNLTALVAPETQARVTTSFLAGIRPFSKLGLVVTTP